MSRAPKLDFEFNGKEFAELLKRAQGSLSLKAYAEKCGVSVSYLCRYLNNHMARPPIPSTIKQMAAYTSQYEVTQDQLLTAAGYSIEKYSDEYAAKLATDRRFKLSIATLNASLAECSFKCTLMQLFDYDFFDFGIEIESDDLKKWLFSLVSIKNKAGYLFTKHMYSLYGMIATLPLEASTKISIVTDSDALFDEIKKTNPKLFPVSVSVILLDPDRMMVLKEDYLLTNDSLTTEQKKRYSLKPSK